MFIACLIEPTALEHVYSIDMHKTMLIKFVFFFKEHEIFTW